MLSNYYNASHATHKREDKNGLTSEMIIGPSEFLSITILAERK